jgi:hypothetical protein
MWSTWSLLAAVAVVAVQAQVLMVEAAVALAVFLRHLQV